MPRILANYTIKTQWEPAPNGDGLLFLLTLEEIPGCMAQGRSYREARRQLQRIFPKFLEAMRARGIEPPAPREGTVRVADLLIGIDNNLRIPLRPGLRSDRVVREYEFV